MGGYASQISFPDGSEGRVCLQFRRPGFDPWVGRREWQPTPVFLPGELHGQRSLVGYNPWSCKESDTTEWLEHTQTCKSKGKGMTESRIYLWEQLACRWCAEIWVTEMIQGGGWVMQRRHPRLSAKSFRGWTEEAEKGSKLMETEGRKSEETGRSSKKPEELRDTIPKSECY